MSGPVQSCFVNEATCYTCLHSNNCVAKFSVQNLKLHITLSHRGVFESFKCAERNCSREFGSNWTDFRRHLITYHKIVKNNAPSDTVLIQNNGNNRNEENNLLMSENLFEESEDVESGTSSIDVQGILRTTLLSLIGRLYANPILPRSHVQEIILEISNLFKIVYSLSKPKSNFQTANTETMSSVDVIQSVIDTLAQFDTEYKRLKVFKSTGFYIEPKPYQVGRRVSEKRVQGRLIKEVVALEGQFINIKKTLKCFFSMPNVLDETLRYMKQLELEEGTISNFVQGALWTAKKELFFQDKTVIPLFFYYDDFEVSNPLGSHAGIQKLGGTYFSIPCLPPEYRSRLDNIFLALLTYASDRHSTYSNICSNSKIFARLIYEINSLQRNGIVITNQNGNPLTIYFAFGLLLGDNEGLNSIQDFVEGFTANFFCRTCKVHKNQTKRDSVERPEFLRTVDSYQEDIAGPQTETGVKARSIWNDIDGHHIYQNFTADLLHDLQEGVLKYAMYNIVFHFVNKNDKKLSIELLNERIRLFDYHLNGFSNRPPLISNKDLNVDKRLKMSGSEMYNFFITFALLVGDVIKEDKVWSYYLLLRKIVDILYAPRIQIECTHYLDYLVAEHNVMYIELFKEHLKPKFHFLVHFGRIIRNSGPLVHLNSLRFEGYHRPNKKRGVATQSRVNLLKTISIKAQLDLCHRFLSNAGLEKNFDIGPSEPFDDEAPTTFPDDFGLQYVEVPWVQLAGTLYKVGMCVVSETDKNDLPIFGIIINIFCNEMGRVCFICKRFDTVGLNSKLHAYEVTETDSICAVYASDLPMYKPVIRARMGSGETVATLRYAL